MQNSKQGACVYCGNDAELTEDHVIPKCLFPDGIPEGAPKVWACQPCNGIVKSGLDQYLRDLLSTDMHTSQSPIVQQMMPKFHRAVKRNRSILARDIVQNSRLVELRTPGGLYGGQAFALITTTDKTLEIMTMYVRGLYAFYFHTMLPQDIECTFARAGISAEVNDMVRYLNNGGGSAGMIGNGNVFECVFGHAHDVPEAGLWILNFMRRAIFVVIVTPKNLSQQPTQTSLVDNLPAV